VKARRRRPSGKKSKSPVEQMPRRAHRTWALVGLALAAAVVWIVLRLVGPPAAAPAPLSVLLVTLDTTRADALGCYGRAGARTPNLDRLAAEGARFTRCVTCAPTTLPSHASLLTAVYPYVHGVRRNGVGRVPDAQVTLAEVLRDAGFATRATIASAVLNRSYGLDQGFEIYNDVSGSSRLGQVNLPERKGDAVTADAIRLLEGVADRRFFLWVHYYDPHFPYESERVPDVESPAAYHDEITFMDAQLGRLLERLDGLGRAGDTLVVVVGDHGEGLGEHGEPMHGDFIYQSTLLCPLLIRCPGRVPASRTIRTLVRTIDLASTICTLTGVPALPQAQGESLEPLLRGEVDDLGLRAYAESFEVHAGFGLSQLRTLIAGDWKYILAPRPELYNLADDAGETRCLLDQQTEIGAELRGLLRELIASAPLPPATETEAVKPDPAQIAQLESLGYTAAGALDVTEGDTELERFEPRGGDPKDFVRAVELNAHYNWATHRQQYSRAESIARQLIEAVPEAPRPRVNLAYVLTQLGRLDEAVPVYQLAIDMAPRDAYIRRSYAETLFLAHRWEEAVAQFGTVLALAPEDTFALYCTAVSQDFLGRPDEAEATFTRALRIEPNSPQVLHGFGVLRVNQNRLAEAAALFRRALTADPTFHQCRQELMAVERELARRGPGESPR